MPGKSAIIELNAASFAAIFKRRMLYCSMAINPFMRAALKALSYPEILDKKNGYRLQRAAVNASHPHVLRPFYKIWDHHILASDHEVPVRVFSPEVEGVFPMLLFFHGGGWVTGNIDSYDKVCTNMARLTRHIVVSVDYRLAPEHRFPAAPEDCYLAAREIFSQCHLFGITPEDIGGCKLGALGVPEFGTDFAMQMLLDTKPKYFSDLVRIAGLAHGTDVWLGNAQTLIQEGKATIQTAICTRDDIMVYLIQQGLEEGTAFTIMESVRKGKGLKPEWEEEMSAHGVPDWYIWSCKKIKYMFPKAHAAAYVMMAWRIAYCKVFYPLAYYASFFSIRASAFSYEIMCLGREKLESHLADYKRRSDSLSKKEQDTLRDMRIVQEMYARGFDFLPMDIYKARARHFQVMGNKLMPSINSIDGLGEKAADSIEEAAKDGPFLSKEDFRNRTRVSKTICDLMGELGILKDLPETNQLSLFDF